MTAAIYLKRAGINPLLVEAKRPGGQINMALKVENFPSYESISGRDLGAKIFEQIKSLGVDYLKDEILTVDKTETGFCLKLKSGNSVECETIFLATGKKNKQLRIPNVNDFLGVGLSYCATCDGMFFKNKDVMVVGDTNEAIEDAIYLANICQKVFILSENSKLSADSYYRKKLDKFSNIEIIYSCILKELVKDDFLTSALIVEKESGLEREIKISGCFACVGYVPNSEMISHLVELNGNNYVIVDKHKKTTCKGIYAIGDVTDTRVYQLVTAMGDAAIAASSYLGQI